MVVSKEQLLDKDSAFVRDVFVSPESSLFVATKQQLIVKERFGMMRFGESVRCI